MIPVPIVGNLEVGAFRNDLDRLEIVFKLGKEGVTGNDTLDQSQVKVGAQGQGLRVNLRSTANENIAGFSGQINLAQVRNRSQAGVLKLRPGQDDGFAVWEGFANGFKSFAAHNDHLAGGHFFEPFKILRKMPGNFVSAADHPVFGHGSDGFEMFHLHVTQGNPTHG